MWIQAHARLKASATWPGPGLGGRLHSRGKDSKSFPLPRIILSRQDLSWGAYEFIFVGQGHCRGSRSNSAEIARMKISSRGDPVPVRPFPGPGSDCSK